MKDCIEKLIVKSQSKKGAEVVIKLAEFLSGKKENKFWSVREKYHIILKLF